MTSYPHKDMTHIIKINYGIIIPEKKYDIIMTKRGHDITFLFIEL